MPDAADGPAWLPMAQVEAQTWSQPTSNTVENLVDVVFSTSATAAAVGDAAATIASGDGGASWVDETVGTLLAADLTAVFSNGVTIVAVGIDQDGGGGEPEAVIASGDRGATWVEITNLPPTDDDMAAGLFVNSTNAVAVSDQVGGEILLSVDRGASWTNPHSAPDALNAVDSRGALVVVAGDALGANETISRSLDAGVNWADASSVPGAGQNMNDVAIVTATTVVAVGQNGEILRSTDTADNWLNPFTAADNLNAVVASNNTLIAVGDSRTIVRSIDAGASWILPTTPSAAGGTNLNDVLFLTSSIALAVGDNGEIYSSDDLGDVWTAQTSTTTENLMAVAYNGINNTVVVGDNGIVLLSRNQVPTIEPIPFASKWTLVLLLVGAGLISLRRLRTAR
ncbi:MAG: hypothetical protein HN712_19490 [Gemmatimonadetes bacterium]|jgi:photosystem II stability/assembly factor-like uncharacterized protein|nr:hypothetical protein [Gemmatimonadota bacterium]MBT7862508.1 hypothetical protein [Gemmatimonadota bacterium]